MDGSLIMNKWKQKPGNGKKEGQKDSPEKKHPMQRQLKFMNEGGKFPKNHGIITWPIARIKASALAL